MAKSHKLFEVIAVMLRRTELGGEAESELIGEVGERARLLTQEVEVVEEGF